ncbi:MAG TPA: ABC transporter ATP-binding protein [Rikenellaceae bacterium]|nr:MAG: hypothetical protein A2X20_07755 [Bacteroidetes bacterium GWE2_40_15]HBZ26030.1 ABC transporter ATP-binding protein [Rikenellaceae bacterium]
MVLIQNLKFSYGKQAIFNNVNLQLESGKIYGLLGQNGVGKTTLLKIISGFLKVGKDECTVKGYSPFERSPLFLENVIFVPEDFIAPDTIVNDYAKFRGEFYPKYDSNKFGRLMTDFEVNGNYKFNKLSYGQQKKALIAFALSTNTNLILLDEPSNGLDIPSKSQLRKVVSEASTDDSCIIISTHQVRDLENLIDPIIILDKNGVLLNESIERISQKLLFSFASIPDNSALYNESTPGGYISVKKNESDMETRVNIEALFNTTLKNRTKISELFGKY